MNRLILGGILCISTGACESSALAPIGREEDVQTDADLGRSIQRDHGAPLQTDSLVYHVETDGEWRSVNIPFRYRNDTGRTIYISNCHGGLNIGLEKRVANEWTLVYTPILLLCLSPPITIAPGEIVEHTASILGSPSDRDRAPVFESDDMEGEYRLVWSGLRHRDGKGSSGIGDGAGTLRSNPFLLVEPSND